MVILNKDNIQEYLENNPKQFIIFNINYSQESKDCIDNFNITEFLSYDNYGDNNLDDLKDFLLKLGSNKDKQVCIMEKIIKDITKIVMSGYNKIYTNYWLTIRATLPDPYFDIPRWHCDGNYFYKEISSYEKPTFNRPNLSKFVTVLQGPGTLFLKTTTQKERDLFITTIAEESQKSYKRDKKTHYEDIIEVRKIIDTKIKGERIQSDKYQAAIFISKIEENDKAICGIHSEPPINVPRLFLSIVPATKDEVEIHKKRNQIKHLKGGEINYYKKYIKYKTKYIKECNNSIS
jgi:hypothetical protein